jgi:hypothetical protein
VVATRGAEEPSLLAGLIFDTGGDRMTPTHAAGQVPPSAAGTPVDKLLDSVAWGHLKTSIQERPRKRVNSNSR